MEEIVSIFSQINYGFILIVGVAAVGLTELIKKFLPENVNAKVVAALALVFSAAFSVLIGLYIKMDMLALIVHAALTIGLSQTSYNFLFKQFKTICEAVQTKVEKMSIIPEENGTEAKLETETEKIVDAINK